MHACISTLARANTTHDTYMSFVEDQASVSKATPTRKRAFGSPSGKRSTVSPWKKRSVSHAIDLLAKIHPDLSGSVSVIFPKEAERLREEIKNMLVDDASRRTLAMACTSGLLLELVLLLELLLR